MKIFLFFPESVQTFIFKIEKSLKYESDKYQFQKSLKCESDEFHKILGVSHPSILQVQFKRMCTP